MTQEEEEEKEEDDEVAAVAVFCPENCIPCSSKNVQSKSPVQNCL
jgi:hypothetical protein